MAVTAGMVKELREMTGAGMMDCKKALSEKLIFYYFYYIEAFFKNQ